MQRRLKLSVARGQVTILSQRARRVAQNQICYLYRYIDISDKEHRDNLVSAAFGL